MINFTSQERKALIFLTIILIIGSGITLYKKYHSDFAPELLFKPKANYSEVNLNVSNVTLPVDTATKTENKVNPSKYSQKIIFPINLNTATQYELERLPSIGPVLAKRIIEYRNQKGVFKTIEEIKKVHGIGNKIFEKIKNYITVSPP